MGEPKALTCLLFGFGYMGRIRYSILRRLPQVSRILCLDPGIAAGWPSGVEVIPDRAQVPWGEVDAVFVCTPNDATASLAAEGLRRCGRVFCEKPPGRNWEEFCQISAAAQEARSPVLVFGFNHRLHPAVQAAKSFLDSGRLGAILYVKGTYGKSGGIRFRESWRSKPEIAGGGILLDQGIHLLDLFSLFLGPLDPVDAVLTDSYWGCGVEDNAFVLLKSRQGIPAFLHSSATLWKHTFRLEIGCREGYVTATGLLSQSGSYGREQLVIGKRQFEDEASALGNPREEIVHFDRDDSWEKEVQEFLLAIQENRPATHGTLEEARWLMQTVHEIYAQNRQRLAGRSPSCA